MESFEPMINLLVFMSVLSIIAERITNFIKLRNTKLRAKPQTEDEKTSREFQITWRSMLIGVVLAVSVKANFFEVMTHLDDPWHTLGWVTIQDHYWTRSQALQNFGAFLIALLGSCVTGLGLGFGNKFWHDILGVVYEVRDNRRETTKKLASK